MRINPPICCTLSYCVKIYQHSQDTAVPSLHHEIWVISSAAMF